MGRLFDMSKYFIDHLNNIEYFDIVNPEPSSCSIGFLSSYFIVNISVPVIIFLLLCHCDHCDHEDKNQSFNLTLYCACMFSHFTSNE